TVGVIIDARGRPFNLDLNTPNRIEKLRAALQAMGHPVPGETVNAQNHEPVGVLVGNLSLRGEVSAITTESIPPRTLNRPVTRIQCGWQADTISSSRRFTTAS